MRKRLRKKLYRRNPLQNRLRNYMGFTANTGIFSVRPNPATLVSLYHPATRQGFQLEFTLKDGEAVKTALARIMTSPTVEQISDYLFQHTFRPRAEPE